MREYSEEEEDEKEVKTSTRTYGPHQTVPPQWGLKRLHAVGIKYSAGITLPWLKVTVGNKCREQSRGSATFQLINVSRRAKSRHYFISDSPEKFYSGFAARLDSRYRDQLAINKILSTRAFFRSIRSVEFIYSYRDRSTPHDSSINVIVITILSIIPTRFRCHLHISLIRWVIERREQISITLMQTAAKILSGNILILNCTQSNAVNIK